MENPMPRRLENEYEARITIYRNGRKITHSDAHGDSPTWALYAAHNDLELEMQTYESDRPDEFATSQSDGAS